MIFEWDEAKNAENRRKHGISFEEARDIWNTPVLTRTDTRFDYGEYREISIGLIRSVFAVTVVHTDRDDRIRIISVRKATPAERRDYERYIRRTLG